MLISFFFFFLFALSEPKTKNDEIIKYRSAARPEPAEGKAKNLSYHSYFVLRTKNV
jgi:hypothetical protein